MEINANRLGAIIAGFAFCFSQLPCSTCLAQQNNRPVEALEASDQRQAAIAKPAAEQVDQQTLGALKHLQDWVEVCKTRIQTIPTYRCSLYVKEEVNGTMSDLQLYHAKFRHEPFSIYMACAAPQKSLGQEIIFVEGSNNGKMLAHLSPSTYAYRIAGTVSLDPKGFITQREHRRPITSSGVRYLIEQADYRSKEGLVDVRDLRASVSPNAKLNGRPCTVIEFNYLIARPQYDCRLCRVAFDHQLLLPVRYEAYADKKGHKEPQLIEEYTYMNIDITVQITDEDFSVKNPSYRFP